MLQDILFAASKLLGPLLDPRVALYWVLFAGIALLWSPWKRAGRVLATLAFVVSLAVG
ncbi:MAG: YdcF family protein, partial [Alphaproteobacteria bacterium]|nr:YdcF family protein [Alphaproteobacteria bacterium]